MAKKMKKLVALMLAIAMMMGFSITASAVRADLEEILYGDPVVSKTTKKTTLNEKGDIPLGIKTAEKQDGFGYEVEIAVPGNLCA